MNKRTSTKADTSNYSRLQNYFIGGVSPNKTPNLVIDLHKEHTSQVKKQRGVLQLPRIFPLHNSLRQRRYLESMGCNESSVFNLRGTRCNQKEQQVSLHHEESILQVDGNEKGETEKTETSKEAFLDGVLARSGIDKIALETKGKIKVYIQEGNNSRLINELIRKRGQLKIIDNKKEANLVWTRFCDWEAANTLCKFSEQARSDRAVSRRKTQMNDKDFKSLKEITVNELKMHNHLKNHYELSDKKCLFRNIRRYCQAEKINEQEIIPRTYHIDSAKDTLPSKVGTDASLWLVKPGEDTNRGTGITIERNRQNIIRAIEDLYKIGKSALVQEYIAPLLFRNRKFDIRCYVLVTSIYGVLRAYWYKEGYLRTCSKEFNDDPLNLFGHLTNDAIQKKCKDYGKFQPCNKLSFSDLEGLLKSKDLSYADTIANMKKLATMSIKSAEQALKGDKGGFSFEILGYDFLLGSNGKVWLIEINTNPCLEFAGSLLSRVIWHMMQNSMAMVLDPLLECIPDCYNSQRSKNNKIYEDNKYECII